MVVIIGVLGVVGRFAVMNGVNKNAPSTLLTTENYDKIRIGMTFDEVEAILGNSWRETSTVGTMQTYVWSEGIFRSITIILDNNRVSAKMQNGLN